MKSCLQDGGMEWCCPSCGVDFLFSKHKPGCTYVREEMSKNWNVLVSKGRDFGDENQYVPTAPVDPDYGFAVKESEPEYRRRMGFDNAKVGIGGAPTRATTLPEGAAERKEYPIASGVADYFPDALVAVANVSWRGNNQHNPGQPLHWARSKSGDEADTMFRHFLQRGTLDTDGVRHSAKMAWRALALLQKEIEAEGRQTDGRIRDEEFTYGGLGSRSNGPRGSAMGRSGADINSAPAPQARSVDIGRHQTTKARG
jgi:hypothetical protein